MSNILIPPQPIFADIDGSPLNEGFIFIGESTKEPTLFPVDAYWDAAKTQLATQPIRTKNGYIVNNGNKASLFIEAHTCSVLVQNRNQTEIIKNLSFKLFLSTENINASIQAEQERALLAESNLSTSVAAENSRATAAETVLGNNIVSEANRAIAAENAIQAQVNAIGVGNKAYLTYAEMDADKANNPINSKLEVTNDPDPAKNYTYQWNGTTLTKSAYDPLTQAKAYADGNALFDPKVLTTENIHSLERGHYINNSVTQTHVDTLNYPLTSQCQIDVIKAGISPVKHVYIQYNLLNRMFYKYFNGSAWTTIELISAEAVKTALEALATVKHRHAQTTHLNDLTAGKWFQTIVSAATTENGYPLAGVCIINVDASEATSIKIQEIYYPTLDRTFNRYFNGTTWTTTEDFTLKNNAVLKSYLAPSLLNEIPNKVEWLPVAAAWSMSYDPATKTLSWPHMLLAPKFSYSSTIRLRVPAGSIQLTTLTGYDYIWLDTTNIDQSTGNAQLSDIKFGTYSTSGYCEKNNQILIAKVDYAGNIHKAEGIPSITVLGQSTQATVKDTFRVVKTANQAYFYTPATNGNLVRYRFYRQIKAFDGTSPDSQSDVWRLADVYEANPNTLTAGRYIVVDGEWDTAIRVTGAADHSGGVHGDELISELQFAPYFLVDGCKIAQNATFDGQVKELTFVQESLIYFENTQNVLCKRLKVMKVTKNGFKNYQKLVFQSVANLFTAWFGLMIPIKRTVNDNGSGGQITDTAIRFPNYIPEDVSVAGFPQVYTDTKDGDEFVISGATSGISIKAKMSGFKGLPKPVTHISSAQFYNKLYFSAIDSRVANYTTQVGETWEVTSEFAIDIK